MAIFHDKEGDKGSFAGGTMGQALAKHHADKKPKDGKEDKGGDKASKISEHLDNAKNSVEEAKRLHEGEERAEAGEESSEGEGGGLASILGGGGE